MAYEDDFVDENAVEFSIDGKIFKYKPVTAGEENSWLSEYTEITNDEKLIQKLDKLNECKTRNIIEVPYDKETIKKIINVEKEWKNLNKEERWKILSKLKPVVFTQIIREITKIDSGESKGKKKFQDSSEQPQKTDS